MDTECADRFEESAAGLGSTVLAPSAAEDRIDEEPHKLCGTENLFTPWYILIRRMRGLEPTRVSTISELRLGAAAACHSCKMVLDALITYCSGRWPIDSIVDINVASADHPILINFRPFTDAIESGVYTVELELFQLEGKSCMTLDFYF